MLHAVPLAIAILSSVVLATPPIFSDLAYDEAQRRARKDDRLLIVDATATWCGPCKRMDRTTWTDPAVEAWLKEHAIAIQFDVDEHPDLAEQLRAHALPTIIAFRDGEELDRIVAYRTPGALLEWLEGLLEGRTSLESLRARAMKKNWRGRYDIRARMQYADALRYAGKFEDALAEYRWLWEHMLEHDASMGGVRRSFLAGDIKELIAEHEPAREVFRHLRDQAEARLKKAPDWDTLLDWLKLNDIIDDPSATMAWVDRMLRDEEGIATLARVVHAIRDTLIEQGRYDALGRLIDNPHEAFEHDLALMKGSSRSLIAAAMSEETRRATRTTARRLFADRAAILHAALLAAGRPDEAWKIFERALWEEDSVAMRLALARHAHAAGVLSERHLALLDRRFESHAELLDEIHDAGRDDQHDARP